MTKEYIERGKRTCQDCFHYRACSSMGNILDPLHGGVICEDFVNAADVVEVVQGYHAGDVCIYGFGHENKSRAIVEIVRVLDDARGVAEIKFHRVFVDDTGNGFFNYLLKTGNTMNASFKYLKNITPRMDGGDENG